MSAANYWRGTTHNSAIQNLNHLQMSSPCCVCSYKCYLSKRLCTQVSYPALCSSFPYLAALDALAYEAVGLGGPFSRHKQCHFAGLLTGHAKGVSETATKAAAKAAEKFEHV